jgi:energy-converting hydrogenase Eha subunit H
MLMLSSVIIILYGWSLTSEMTSIVGAGIFLLALLINLYKTYLISKKHNNKNDQSIEQPIKKHFISKTEEVIEGLITIASLVGTLVFHEKGDIYFYTCFIIWMGVIIIYFISGVVIREFANIPLIMGYGGWKIYYKKSRRSK